MGTYAQITNFESFEVSTTTGKSTELYANGLQQSTIYIRMIPLDGDSNYVTLNSTELDKLVNNLELINYNTSTNDLQRISEPDARTLSVWAYTQSKGEYVQLNSSGRSGEDSEAGNNDNTITVEYYIMCSEKVTQRQISVAASVTLGNGDTISTDKKDGFDSSVIITTIEPLVYQVLEGAEEGDGRGLSITKTRVYTGLSDVLGQWADNYYVTISNSDNPSIIMRHKLFYPEGSSSGTNKWPSLTDFDHSDILSEELCFSVSAYGRARSLCYIYDESSPTTNTLGMGGYSQEISLDFESNAFNFTSIHLVTWPQHAVGGQASLHTMHCEFYDQYGNYGQFKASPINVTNDEFHRASFIIFSNY